MWQDKKRRLEAYGDTRWPWFSNNATRMWMTGKSKEYFGRQTETTRMGVSHYYNWEPVFLLPFLLFFGHLVLWSRGPLVHRSLVPWSFGPVVLWSLGPLVYFVSFPWCSLGPLVCLVSFSWWSFGPLVASCPLPPAFSARLSSLVFGTHAGQRRPSPRLLS